MSIKKYVCMLMVVIGCAQSSLLADYAAQAKSRSKKYQSKTMPRDTRYSDTVYKESLIPTDAISCSNTNNQCYCSFKCDYRDRVDAEDIGMWDGIQHKCYCKERDIRNMSNCDLK